MNLKKFFRTYLNEDALYRSLILYSYNFKDIESLITFKISALYDNNVQELVENLSIQEVKTIEKLVSVQPNKNVYYLEHLKGLETLYNFDYVLQVKDGFVTHFEIISSIYKQLLNLGIINNTSTMLLDEEIQEPGELKKLKSIYTGSIDWLYNNLTSTHLRKIIIQLNINHYGSYKDEFIRTVVQHLTIKEYLEQVLEHLTQEELQLIEENVNDNVHIYRRRTRWKEAENLGILVKVHRDYLIMHDDVLTTMKTINFKEIISKINLTTHFNAYHLHLTIEDIPSIKRDLIIPTRLNFYELIWILKTSFGWTNNTNSYVEIGDYVIDEFRTTRLFGSMVQVDYLLETYHTFKFFYNSIDNYVVQVSLIGTKSVDRLVPEITMYGGQTPIENIGDRETLFKIFDILNNKNHPDYATTYQKVRRKNYRERFPITAINKKLSRVFRKERPYIE